MEGVKKVETLRAACCVVGIDGQTSEAERRILETLADEVGVGTASLAAMIERAETDMDFCDEQFRVLKADPKETMQLLFSVALADGKLRKDEHFVLRRFGERLDVTAEMFDQWTKQALKYLEAKKGQSS